MSSLKDIQDKYPIFEANQVLTNRHLNAVFDYLDKQERLTRTHLIGIGIVCGFEVTWDASSHTVTIGKGCGVTSEGYLVKTPALTLTALKDYVSSDPIYLPFQKENEPTVLLEGILELTDNAADRILTPAELKDKALVLFIELKNEGLRNCSPNNCDDKGREVTASVKPLLVPKDFAKNLSQTPKIEERLALPDFRLPRFDVPKTGLTDTQNVLKAFHVAAQGDIFEAIKKARNVFAPLIGSVIIAPNLLQKKTITAGNALFLQHYYDFTDDLIQAYDEFRWKALDLFCSCCPESNLFAQHLILGEFDATGTIFSEQNRTTFIASPAISDCDKEATEVKMLFERLAAMLKKFDLNFTAKEVRITPNKQGAALSQKAIPYYYDPAVEPALHLLWNPEKTRRKREKQNLGYHADRYAMDDFVKAPLTYDLEPYNFLRIEGHLGQHYQEVLKNLLSQKIQFRLPIDIIALRTGSFDENIKIDFSKEKCHFEDLEAIYDAFREELRCSLGKTIIKLGSIKIADDILAAVPAVVRSVVEASPLVTRPAAGLSTRSITHKNFFQALDADFTPAENTIGAFIQNSSGIFKETVNAAPSEVVSMTKLPIMDLSGFVSSPIFNSPSLRASLTFIGQLNNIINILTNDLSELNWEEFQKEYEALKKLKPVSPDGDFKEIAEQLTAVISACRLEGLKSIIDEYRRRLKEVKQKQFLSFFLQKHPGIQHKSGVPLGGTFILVYHQNPEPVKEGGKGGLVLVNEATNFQDFVSTQSRAFPTIQPKIMIGDRAFAIQDDLLAEIQKNSRFFDSNDLALKLRPLSSEKIIEQAVQKLPDGAVIADFFLPYVCTSDCAPVQFVLPKTKPTFTFKIIGCPDPQNQGMATVVIKPQGGTPDYELSVNEGAYEKLSELQLSGTNKVKIRDAEGIESVEQTIQISAPISVEIGAFEWENTGKTTYKQDLTLKGGVAPYQVTLNEIKLESQPASLTVTGLKAGESYQLTVTDSNPDAPKGCSYVHKEPIKQGCDLPCGGLKVKSFYLFPVQIRQESNKIAVKIIELSLEGETLVKDVGQDVSPLEKTLQFLKDTLNRKPDSWAISATNVFKDSNGRPQMLGLQIERFVCQKFKLTLELTENNSSFQVVYTEEGVEIVEKSRRPPRTLQYKMPAFEHENADLCAANNKFQRRCKNENFEIGYDFERQTAKSLPEGIVTSWYWEKENGEKSNKPEQDLGINSSSLLIGFTKEGCFKIVEIARIPG